MGNHMKSSWAEYNKSLENRGSINFWFSDDAIKKWQAENLKKKGRPFIFSDDAILALLMIRFVYHLPFRQLVGFAKSLIQLLGLSLDVPHFTCIQKRMKKLTIPKKYLDKRYVTDIVFDTSGLRVYSSGEWKKKKYGGRRRWKKIHLGINLSTKEIIFSKATDEYVHDLAHMEEVLKCGSRRKGKLLVDGIADTHGLYKMAAKYGKQLVTPPRKGASPLTGTPFRRNSVRFLHLLGNDQDARAIWGKLTGYSQRSHVEGAFSTWKRIFGEELLSRTHETIDSEVYAKSLIYNKMKNSQRTRHP
jgi:hypothetical protein